MLTLVAAVLFFIMYMWAVQKRRRQAQAAVALQRRLNRRS